MSDEIEELAELARRALRKNQPRGMQLPWVDAVEIPNYDEMAYMQAASPALILRLIKMCQRRST